MKGSDCDSWMTHFSFLLLDDEPSAVMAFIHVLPAPLLATALAVTTQPVQRSWVEHVRFRHTTESTVGVYVKIVL